MSTVCVWSLLSRARLIHEAFSSFRLVQAHRLLSNDSTAMALKISLSHKALESPFSHVEMYGCEHPSSIKVTASGGKQKAAKSKSGRGVGIKLKQSSAKSFSGASTYSTRSSTVSSTSSSKHKKKGTKTSPMVAKQIRNGIIRNRNVTETTSAPERRSQGLIKVDHDSPVLKPGRAARGSQLYQRNGVWKNSKTSVHGSIGTKSVLDPPTTSKPLSSTGSSTVSSKSLLARSTSTMSTSEVLLSFNKDLRKSGTVDCSANVRLSGKVVKNINLPPHMHLPRRAFVDNERKTPPGRTFKGSPKGTAKGGPLTIEDIGIGLGKMQYRNVIVMSGAGVSTASGIPDFR